MISTVAARKYIRKPSATRQPRLGQFDPPRGSQLCVPASQQVCLYRCNRTEKSKLPGLILPWPTGFVKF